MTPKNKKTKNNNIKHVIQLSQNNAIINTVRNTS